MRANANLVCFGFLLLFLATGCSRTDSQTQYAELADQGEWQKLSQTTSLRLRQDLFEPALVYKAEASLHLDQAAQAFDELQLALSVLRPDDSLWTKANSLMVEAGVRSQHYEQAVASGRLLEQAGTLDAEVAVYQYRALQSLGLDQEAGHIMKTWLRNRLDPVVYARALIQSNAVASEIGEALQPLDVGNLLPLLELVVEKVDSRQRAESLLDIVLSFESRASEHKALGRYYALLSLLYQKADRRVSARKYASLAEMELQNEQ